MSMNAEDRGTLLQVFPPPADAWDAWFESAGVGWFYGIPEQLSENTIAAILSMARRLEAQQDRIAEMEGVTKRLRERLRFRTAARPGMFACCGVEPMPAKFPGRKPDSLAKEIKNAVADDSPFPPEQTL
jgi:hypothetical protein